MHGNLTKMSNLLFNFPPTRGLCSCLISLLGLYEEQIFGDKKTIRVNASRSCFFKNVCFYDVFETNDIITNVATEDERIIEEQHSRIFAKWLGRKRSWWEASTKTILNYTPVFHRKIQSVISQLDLPETFACIHIRRGDKVGEKTNIWTKKTGKNEAKRHEFADYLEQCHSFHTIFIMTDDYKCIQEADEYISKNNLPHKIMHLTNKSQTGYSTTLNMQNNRTYSEQELVQFFSEIEIAKLSKIFVGTRTSNVFRYILNTCTSDTKFVNIGAK